MDFLKELAAAWRNSENSKLRNAGFAKADDAWAISLIGAVKKQLKITIIFLLHS